MKKILFAALTALLLVAVCVLGLIPALSRNEAGALVADQLNAAGATVNAEQIKTAMSTKKTAPAEAVAVGTAAQWAAMTSGGTYKLTADITVSGSLGTAAAPFDATIYGDGHTVTASAPLFANAGTLSVYDLTVAGTVAGNGALADTVATLTATNVANKASVTGTGTVGGLVGTVGAATMENCINLGAVKGGNVAGGLVGQSTGSLSLVKCSNGDDAATASVSATYTLGGLVGSATGSSVKIENCLNYVALSLSSIAGESAGGGIVGYIEATKAEVKLCSNAGTISGPALRNKATDVFALNGFGGMIGRAAGGSTVLEVTDCMNVAGVTIVRIDGSTADHNGVGGILGFDLAYSTTITGCVNMGNVGTGGVDINPGSGGILGQIQYNDAAKPKKLTVKDCVNSGNVAARRAGGIIGIGETVNGVVVVENCTNSGAISSTANYAAGIAARLEPQVAATEEIPYPISFINCTNAGNVTTGGGNCAGGIFGYNSGTQAPIYFENCQNFATITNMTAGGIAANVAGGVVMEGCSNSGTVSGSKASGGLIGAVHASYADLRNCTNTGDISSTGGNTGGLVGSVKTYAIFTDCQNDGDITVGNGCAAGVVGLVNDNVTMTDCTNNGDVTVATGHAAGMIAGPYAKQSYLRCTNNGDITVTATSGSYDAGGIAGRGWTDGAKRDGTSTFTDCVNTGNITNHARMAGGILGWNDHDSTFERCVNTGNVTGITNVGGMAGQVTWRPVVTSCINMGYVEGGQIVGGFIGSCCSNGHDSAKFVGNVNTGNVHNTGAKSTDKSHGAGGICGYVYGIGHFYYNTVTGDVTGNFPTSRTTLYDKSACAAICGYQNNNSGEYIFNYFTGTLEAKNGTNVLLKVTPGENCLCDNSGWGSTYLKWNYTTTDYPFYTEGECTKNKGDVILFDPNNSAIHNQHMVYEGWLVTAEDVANGNLLNTLNTAIANAPGKVSGFADGAYVQVKICDKVNMPIFNGTAALYEQWCGVEHDYTEQKTDAESHWYECTCGEVSPEGKIAHELSMKVDANNHWMECPVCGYVSAKEVHNIVTDFDETHHWTACDVCGEVVSEEAHSFTEPVPSIPYHHTYACSCGATSGEDVVHVYNVTVVTDEGHLMVCECGDESPAGVTAHTATSKLYTDAEYHWNQCVCGYVMNKSAHASADGVEANCQTELVCETCGVSFGGVDLGVHTKDISWTLTETTHYGWYPCCGVEVEETLHDWHETENKCTICDWVCVHAGGDASCSQLAACQYCGKGYGELDPDDHRNNATDATCMAVAHCADCDRDYGEKNMSNHAEGCVAEYLLTEGNEALQHTLRYTLCLQVVVTEDHTVGTAADCDSKAVCAVCALEYGEVDLTNHDALCGIRNMIWITDHEGIATNHKGTYPVCGQSFEDAHSFDVGTCTVCSYVCVAHGPGSETVFVPIVGTDFEAGAHDVRYACCGVLAGRAAHTYENGVCTGCGYTCAHAGGFTYEKISDTEHSKTCEACGIVVNEAHHQLTAATCQTAAYCGLCSSSYGEKDANAHRFDTAWMLGTEGEGESVVYYHYHKCLNTGCTAEDAKGICDGEATCVAKAKCSVCEKERGEIAPDAHNFEAEWTLGTKEVEGVTVYYHYHECLNEGCEVKGAEGDCDGEATCVAKAKCSVCALEHGELNAENHASAELTLKSDAENGQHYSVHSCCEVEIEDSREACSVGESGTAATCQAAAICGTCGQSFGEPNAENHVSTETTLKTDAEHGQHYYVHNCCEVEVINTRVACAVGENGTAATCQAAAICGTCGQSFGEVDPNNHANTETQLVCDDHQQHHSVYVCCPTVTVADSTVDHVFENCVCACGYSCSHVIDEHTSLLGAWTKLDDEKHVRSCTNCDYTEEQAHTASTSATCQSAAHCDVCDSDFGTPDANAHIWSEEYTVEDERHYKTCTLECDAISEEATHTYDRYAVQADIHWLECICGKENPENSREPHEMVDHFDENNHWSICVCGKSTEVEAHNFVYDKTEEGHLEKCACGVTRGTLVEHTYSAETGSCTVCEYTCLHTGDRLYVTDTEAADKHDVFCITCGLLLENDADHSYDSGSYVSDDEHHWVACLCGVKQDEEAGVAHTGGTATCKDKALCEVCGAAYGQLDPENHVTPEVFDYWVDPEDLSKHVKAYDCCGAEITTETHTFESGVCKYCEADCVHTGGTATCKDQAVCTVCGTAYGELAPTNHTFGDWKVTTAPTTTAKGVETRTCTGCGATETRDVDKLVEGGGSSSDNNADHNGDGDDTNDGGLSTGVIVAIVAGSIILVGIIIGVIVWVVKGRSATANAEAEAKPWRTKEYKKAKWKKKK